jgi:hypothetical protein
VYVRFEVSTVNATTLAASVSGGGPVRMCYSFDATTPEAPNGTVAPGAVCAAILPPPATAAVISILPEGAANDFVYVSLRAIAGGAVCGGDVTVSTVAGCSVPYAEVVPVPGDGAGNSGVNIVRKPEKGTPYDVDRCVSCFGDDVLLAAEGSGDPYAGTCGPECRGSGQYAREGGDPAFPSDFLCTNCHAACVGSAAAGGACEAPSALTLGAEPLSCTACPSGFLLPVASDPAISSPWWDVSLSRNGSATPPPLAGTSGRCVPACPAGLSSDGPLPARPPARATTACRGDLTAFAATSRTLSVTVCVPNTTAVPPGFNSTLASNSCTAFWGDRWGRDATVAAQLADAMGLPRGAVFLRSCTDLRERAYYVTRYGAGVGDWFRVEEPDIATAFANATRRAASDCFCDVVATFSVLMTVASPGEPPFVGTFTSDETTMRARAELALARLIDAPLNTSGAPLGRRAAALAGAEHFALAPDGRSLQAVEPTGGYGPLKCTFNKTRLLGACIDDFYTATQLWGADNVRSRNIISLCGGRPPPEVPGFAPFPLVLVVAAAGGSILFLILLAVLLLLWARRVTIRLAAIAAHRAKVARWRKRGRAGGEGVDGAGGEEEDDWDPSSLDAGLTSGKAAFGLTGAVGGSPSSGGGGARLDVSLNAPGFYAEGADSAVGDWAPGKRPVSATVVAVNPLRAAGVGAEGEAVTPESLAAARRAAVAAAANGVGTAGAAARKAQLAAAAERAGASRAPTREASTEDTFWLGLPYRALSPREKVWEWAFPGSQTLGMGVCADAVPPSHDVTHALGPKSEFALALSKVGAGKTDSRVFLGLAEVVQLQRANAASSATPQFAASADAAYVPPAVLAGVRKEGAA